MAAKWKQGAARTGTAIVGGRSRTRQVVAAEQRGEAPILSKRCGIKSLVCRRRGPALRCVVEPRVANKYRDAVCVQTRRVDRRIDDSEIEMFGQKRLLIRNSKLNVVHALHVGQIGTHPSVGQRPILRNGLLLQIGGTEIGKWIVAGIVIENVPPDPAAETKDSSRIDHSSPGRSDVEALDQRALVGGSDNIAVRIETPIGDHHSIPRRGKLAVKSVGCLEPRTRKAQVQVNRVLS